MLCCLFSVQGKFSVIPSVFVTAAHYRAALKRDAASVWIEDVTQSSFKVCLRELQNYAGSHEDVYTVSVVVVFLSSLVLLQVYGSFQALDTVYINSIHNATCDFFLHRARVIKVCVFPLLYAC